MLRHKDQRARWQRINMKWSILILVFRKESQHDTIISLLAYFNASVIKHASINRAYADIANQWQVRRIFSQLKLFRRSS